MLKNILLLLCVFASLAWPPCGAVAQERPRLVRFDIPAQRLSRALIDFGLQAGLSIGVPSNIAKTVRSSEVREILSPSEALGKLLNGSGYDFEFLDTTAVQIVPAANGPAETEPAESIIPAETAIANPADYLEEVVVTATKRSIRLLDLPVSGSVMTDDRLVANGVVDFRDIPPLVPGVSAIDAGPGQSKILIRGISDGAFSDRTQQSVGFYLNETPITFSHPSPDLRLVDMDRVEIMRGPQGTLFGAGSIGGMVRLITNRPDPSKVAAGADVSTSLTESGGPSYDAAGFANFPLIADRMAVRLVGYYGIDGGYIDDIDLGLKNINRAETVGGRAAVVWQLDPDVSLAIDGAFHLLDADDSNYAETRFGRLRRENALREPLADDFYQGSATLKAALRWFNLTATASFVSRDITSVIDATSEIPALLGISGAASPFSKDASSQTYVFETRLTSISQSGIQWLAGLYYSRLDEDNLSVLTVPGAGQLFADIGFPDDQVFSETRHERIQELAGFNELSYDLSENVAATAGLRWSINQFSAESLVSGVTVGETALASGEADDPKITPKFALRYSPDLDRTYYLQAAKGFRPGGNGISTLLNSALDRDNFFGARVVSIAPARSDELWNFELGARTIWQDGRLMLNGAVFGILWNNIQSDQIADTGFMFVTNAGDARSIGFEAEATAIVLPNLEVNASVSWQNAQITNGATLNGTGTSEATVVKGGPLTHKGDAPPGTAKFSGSVAVDYSRHMATNLEMFAHADYSYIGTAHLTFDATQSPRMGGYGVANFRTGIQLGAWRVAAFLNNVFNSGANVFAFGNSFNLPTLTLGGQADLITPLRPRTIGLRISVQY